MSERVRIHRKPVFWFVLATGLAAGGLWGPRAGLFAWAVCSFLLGLVIEMKE